MYFIVIKQLNYLSPNLLSIVLNICLDKKNLFGLNFLSVIINYEYAHGFDSIDIII